MSRPSIGLLFAGDARDAGAWSGIPAGLAAGLDAAGADVVHLRAEPPGVAADLALNGLAALHAARSAPAVMARPSNGLRAARRMARASAAMAALRGRAAARSMAAAPSLDAVVQLQAELLVETDAPLATYEDLTVALALRHGYAELTALPRREQQRRLAIQREAYERAAACCVTTRWARDSVVADYGIDPAKVHLVGIATDRRPTGPIASRDWTVPRFLFVGFDWERKNGDLLLRVFDRVRRRLPSARLDVVGGHPSPLRQGGVVGHGPLRLGIPAERARVDDLYRRATCYVMPSRVEPSAIVHVEAASFGVPSIATAVGGSAELVGDGGVVVDPADEDALFDAMVAMADPERAQALGEKARARSQLYTWPLVAGRILASLGFTGAT